MAKLTDLGFSEGVIVETIVSTYDSDGQPNAAPMGTIMESAQRITIKLYNSSLTLQNFQSNRCAVMNVTSNIELFYRTAFKEIYPIGKLPREWFERAESVNAPKLSMADAVIEVSVASMVAIDAERTKVMCDVILIRAPKNFPQAYCRAFSSTLEAIIHATRVKVFLDGDEKQKAQALKLQETIEDCREVVNRVAPKTRYSEIMAEIAGMIDSWRKARVESIR
ncbi:MAG TPA: DUF447 domain-containing protein [Candidatus Bathyarchaeia archaeon]|nr:DUF447 domain-containing protein [Candidatus Bathyarchaeia archaeon]